MKQREGLGAGERCGVGRGLLRDDSRACVRAEGGGELEGSTYGAERGRDPLQGQVLARVRGWDAEQRGRLAFPGCRDTDSSGAGRTLHHLRGPGPTAASPELV